MGGWRNARPWRPARASAAGVAIFARAEAYQDDGSAKLADGIPQVGDPVPATTVGVPRTAGVSVTRGTVESGRGQPAGI